jgi:hypothetical protein
MLIGIVCRKTDYILPPNHQCFEIVCYAQRRIEHMRIARFSLVFSIPLLICGCRGCFRTVSDAIVPSGGNPELITYLQGTWVLNSNDKLALQIKRDSILEFYNDSLRSTRNLSYVFAGTAENFFTKDSAFDFTSNSGRSLSSDEFKLVENGESSSDTVTRLLAYVSKSRLTINSHGNFGDYKRVK